MAGFLVKKNPGSVNYICSFLQNTTTGKNYLIRPISNAANVFANAAMAIPSLVLFIAPIAGKNTNLDSLSNSAIAPSVTGRYF